MRRSWYSKIWTVGFVFLLGAMLLYSYFDKSEGRIIVSGVSQFQYPISAIGETEPYGIPNPELENKKTCWNGALWPTLNHAGIDIYSGVEAEVRAVANGKVVYRHVGSFPGGGLVLKHELADATLYSVYAHLVETRGSNFDNYLVADDQIINKGDVIGHVLNQGSNTHLHFEIRTLMFPNEPAGCSPMGSGYTPDNVHPDLLGYIDPLRFIDDFNFYANQQNGAVVFENTFFRGSGYGYLKPGFYSFNGSYLNNNGSSMALPIGWGATVYEGESGNGAQKLFDQSDYNFANDGYSTSNQSFAVDNTVSSIRVYPGSCTNTVMAASVNSPWVVTDCNPDPLPNPSQPPVPPPSDTPQNPGSRAVLCLQNYYQDCRYELNVGWYDVPDIEYNSISIPSGWSMILVDKTDGHESCYNHSLDKLADHESWRFNIAEITVTDSNVCTSGGGYTPEPLGTSQVRFWMKPGFTGSSARFTFVNETNTYWLPSFTFPEFNFNDDVESFELNTSNNRSMALYRDSMLQGPAKCFTSSADNLWSHKFNDGSDVANQASSVRFFVGNGCDLRPQTPMEMWVHHADKGKVVLTWPWGGPDDDRYYVYLYDGSTYQRIATLDWTQARDNARALGLNEYIRSWTFTNVTCGQQYSFAVSSWNEFGESPKTHSVTTNTQPCDCNDVVSNGVVFFEDAICRGAKVEAVEPAYVSFINFNDKISSIRIPNGWSVEVFENSSSSNGLATCMTESKWDLSLDKYWPSDAVANDTISTAQVFNVPNCARKLPIAGCEAVNYDGIALFDYKYCLGQDRLFNQPGFYNLYDFDNQSSSVHVKPGWSVRVYQENTRSGKYSCFNETKWDLAQDPYWRTELRAGNDITSIEVFHDSICGGVPMPEVYQPENVTDQTDLTLRWQQTYAATYWIELWGPDGFYFHTDVGEPQVHIGVQKAGFYAMRLAADAMGHLSEVATMTYTVASTAPPQQITVSYTADPVEVNKITFYTSNCSGQWVHVVFGDGAETDSPCQNGVATTQHNYTYLGAAVTYTAVVGGIPVTINIGAAAPEKDCSNVGLQAGVALFDQINCKGNKRTFTTAGNFTLADFNDAASAIVLAPNWSVEVFENANSSDGHAYCVTRDIWDLSFESYYAAQGFKLDKSISNIRVYNNPTCGKQLPQYGGCDANIQFEGIVLFDYIHCGGSEQKFNQPGRYELGYGGSFNDLTTSIHVAKGWSVQVFADSSWQGAQLCIHGGDMWDLNIDKYWETNQFINNSISSVQVFNNETCTIQTPPTPVKPAAPTNLRPSGGTFEVAVVQNFSWEGSADSYFVEFMNASTKTSYSMTTTVHSIQFDPPEVGQYTWHVKAVKAGLESEWSNLAAFTVQKTNTAPTKPSAPTALKLSAVTASSISLNWTDTSSDEVGFSVKRWNGQDFVEIARVGANTTSYTDSNLQCATQYKYVVTAFNSVGESAQSPEVVVTTQNCNGNQPKIYLPLIRK